MTRGTLVCITGLDGAGKSTLTKAVVEELQLEGYDAVGAYGRFLPRLTYPLILLGQRTVLSDSDITEDYETHQSTKNDLFESTLLSSLYEGIIMADYIPQFFCRVVLSIYQYDIVVCDRYFYDTLLTDLAGDVINEPADAIRRYNLYSKFLPQPDHEFYVQTPAEVSMRRKDDVPSIEYIQDRKSFYDSFAEKQDLSVLDGTLTSERLTKIVLRDIHNSPNL